MSSNPSDCESRERTAAQFATTHWSVVLAAGRDDSPAATTALEQLCAAYWYPLYAYVRRRGYGAEDARDLTQGFFARLLRRNPFPHLQPRGARFRSFLLSALHNYLISEWEKDHAQKRGGHCARLPIDVAESETRYALEAADAVAPDEAFERRWAEAVLVQALRALREEQTAQGKLELFEALAGYLTGTKEALPYAELAPRLGSTESALRSTVHRLRRRYGELLRQQVAQTVSSPAEVDEELRHLLAALSRGGSRTPPGV
jgi:RNA polymerase sigma-70 factor (ECF subfamily)